MNLKEIIIIMVIVLIFGGIGILAHMNGAEPSGETLKMTSAEELSALIDQVYEGANIELPSVMTQVIDTTDPDMVQAVTGLASTADVEYVVVSEPMMTSQAYSFVLVTVKDGADANAIAKEMNENIDARKWICVTAEKVYTTSSGNVICLVMSSEENAKPVYEQFKTIAGNVGQEYERTQEEAELPADMY